MTQLLERQQINRRIESVQETEQTPHRYEIVSHPDASGSVSRNRTRPLLRSYRRVVLTAAYTVAAIGLSVLLLFLIGATVSLVRSSDAQEAPIPMGGSAVPLVLSDFVEVNEFAVASEGGAVPARSLSRFEPVSYTVRRGDTVSEIAASFGVRMDTIISYNQIEDVRSVQAGSVLLIPAYEHGEYVDGVIYTVRPGDSLSGVATRFGIELTPILDANRIETEFIQPGDVLFIPDARMSDVNLRRALGTLFVRPVNGRLTSPFGMRLDPFTNRRSMHYGVDWANVEGTPVRASNGGVVSVVGESRLYGTYIVIDHYDQFQTLYAHLSSVSVREGSRVGQGVTIGKVGNTGASTGPHLHFTIYKNHQPVDPLDYVH